MCIFVEAVLGTSTASLAINQSRLPAGSVLLIDDMVDSRWTMTVAAWLLRKAGSGDVFPLALALTAHG